MSNNLNSLIMTTNAELDKLPNWFKSNKLSLNIAKTNLMLFKPPQHRLLTTTIEVGIDGVAIERVKKSKLLGITNDENLTWKPHIQSVENKVSRNIGIIKRIQCEISSHIAFLLHDTMILPHLSYCTIIYLSELTSVSLL